MPIYKYGKKLPDGYYMLWIVGQDKGVSKAIEHFKKKYGYKPTEIVIGAGVAKNLDVSYLKQAVGVMCPTSAIKLR